MREIKMDSILILRLAVFWLACASSQGLDQCQQQLVEAECTYRINCKTLSDITELENRNKYRCRPYGAQYYSYDYGYDAPTCGRTCDPLYLDDVYFYKINFTVDSPVSTNDIESLLKIHLFPFNSIDFSKAVITYDPVIDMYLPSLVFLNLSGNAIDSIDLSFSRIRNMQSLTYIDYSHNTITTIISKEAQGSGTVELAVELKKIDLSYNYLVTIPDRAFRNYVELTYLDLSHNFIETINNLTFEGLRELKVLNLFHNRISEMNYSILRLTKLEELDLSHNQIQQIKIRSSFMGLDRLEILNLNSNGIETISSTAFKTLIKLNMLDLSNNRLTNIEFQKDDLLNLKSLLLQNNFLTHIENEYFKDLYFLKFLDLSNNNITEISPKCFGSLQNLETLKISNNPLRRTLKQNTFDGLNSLTTLDISGTMITVVENGSFYGMQKLKTLNMSHSTIEHLQYSTFNNTAIIESIDLSNNKLKTFNVNASQLLKLSNLILYNNIFENVSSSNFSGLKLLSYISLARNNIMEIDSEAFRDQNNVSFLDISFNPHIHINVTQLIKSSQLCISGIRKITFKNVPFRMSSVRSLELSHAHIQDLKDVEIRNLNTLNTLDLSYNNIKKVEAKIFSNMKNLQYLDISHNEIDYIQPAAFEDCAILNTLNVSHNSIKTVGYGVFRGLKILQILDLSFNSIESLSSVRFYEVPRLSELIIDHNFIQSFDIGGFSDMSLTKLSIGDNLISCERILIFIEQQNTLYNKKVIKITAATLDEYNGENVYGIGCSNLRMVDIRKGLNNKITENNETIVDIKNAIHKLSELYQFENKKITDIFNNIIKAIENTSGTIIDANNKIGESVSRSLELGDNKTNLLLDKISKAITDMSELPVGPKPTPAGPELIDVSTADRLVVYINKIKHDLENTVALEKQNIEQVKLNMTEQRADIEKLMSMRQEVLPVFKFSGTSNMTISVFNHPSTPKPVVSSVRAKDQEPSDSDQTYASR